MSEAKEGIREEERQMEPKGGKFVGREGLCMEERRNMEDCQFWEIGVPVVSVSAWTFIGLYVFTGHAMYRQGYHSWQNKFEVLLVIPQ